MRTTGCGDRLSLCWVVHQQPNSAPLPQPICERGDRRLFGRAYRQNTGVSKSFGILADWPES
jgi:hypothetical protein